MRWDAFVRWNEILYAYHAYNICVFYNSFGSCCQANWNFAIIVVLSLLRLVAREFDIQPNSHMNKFTWVLQEVNFAKFRILKKFQKLHKELVTSYKDDNYVVLLNFPCEETMIQHCQSNQCTRLSRKFAGKTWDCTFTSKVCIATKKAAIAFAFHFFFSSKTKPAESFFSTSFKLG